MKTPYTNDFLNQYTIGNYPVQRNAGIGAGIGGVAGGGLGALFASLAGVNPGLGLVGAIPGALLGGTVGLNTTGRKAYDERLAAWNNLSPAQQRAAVRAFVNDMNTSSQNAGIDGNFEQWQSKDPFGFEQFMLKNM